jgi:hypothetical protein
MPDSLREKHAADVCSQETTASSAGFNTRHYSPTRRSELSFDLSTTQMFYSVGYSLPYGQNAWVGRSQLRLVQVVIFRRF